jgi:hypothetical protein
VLPISSLKASEVVWDGRPVDCARARACLGRVGACVAAFSLADEVQIGLRISHRDWQDGSIEV